MNRKTLLIIMLTIACAAAAQKESSDMRPAVGAGFAIPTFDRSGMNWMAHGDIAILPFLIVSPELGFGHWNMLTAGSEFLSPDESNRQFWEHTQNMSSQYLMLGLRGYPRLSPYLLLGAGLENHTYDDKFMFWGTYNDQFEWEKKGETHNTGSLPFFTGGIGLDMPLDSIWSLNYEYRWVYFSGKVGDENIIATDGFGQAGSVGKQVLENYLLQYPITISVEVRPW
jgi:hypothetical protein